MFRFYTSKLLTNKIKILLTVLSRSQLFRILPIFIKRVIIIIVVVIGSSGGGGVFLVSHLGNRRNISND